MSAQGRCAGDGRTGELREIAWHVTTCPQWAALFLQDPDAALGPVEEYDRWRAQEAAGEHAQDLAGRVADTVAQRAKSVARFKRADPLED